MLSIDSIYSVLYLIVSLGWVDFVLIVPHTTILPIRCKSNSATFLPAQANEWNDKIRTNPTL